MFCAQLTDENCGFDEGTKLFEEAAKWAKKHCSSFKDYDLIDVSDFSVSYDTVGLYNFESEKDLLLFTLRWS